MSKIMALTADQESTFQHYIDRWTAIGLSTEPIDREKHDESICAIYKLAGLKEPRIVYVDCALSGAIASGILTDEGAMDTVRDTVWGSVRVSVGASVIDSVGDSVRVSVRDSVRDSVMGSVGDSVRGSVRDSVRDSVMGSVGDSVMGSVWDSVRDSVMDSVGDSVMGSVWDSVRVSVGDSVMGSVWGSVRVSVGASVMDSVRDSVRGSVWDSVGDSVRGSVWGSVRDSVLGSVWGSVWGSVRVSVGDSVRGSVIDSVRATKIKWVDWLYGNMWAGYGAWGEFFLEQCGVDVNRDCLNHMEHGHWIWPLDGLCLCSERPIAIYTDNQGRNHRENGPAVEYPTGWGPFVWHGTIVPPEWLLGKPPTAAEAIKWENMEQRRAACEILGWVNVLNELNARTIDKHKNYAVGELLEVDIPDIGKGRFLRVMCGTQREFALPVPPDMDTAENAQRWLNFIPDDIHFIPEVRT